MRSFFFFCFFSFFVSVQAQTPTVGLIYNSGMAADGYTLFVPELGNDVYLIDNCGSVVNQWTCSEPPGLTCYLLENGNLLYAGLNSIELRNWDNALLWSYQTTSNGIGQHHDIEPLPNGNVLCIARDNRTIAELIDAGRDPNLIDLNSKMDRIVEIQPFGASGGSVVWEWRFWDHLIQDYDSTKTNFGVVANHPELLDLNFDQIFPNDLTHINSIDYNDSLNQIIISSKHYSEIYIIDHSSTTVEAASHLGGNAGLGGDFLWRWGNPQVYGFGTSIDQQLYGPHDAKWVNDGYLNDGKISVFNNGGDGTGSFSSVHLIQPEMNGFNYTITSNTFAPDNFDFSWNGDAITPTIFASKKCGAISLPQGGFMICETSTGRFIEINENKDVVWQYRSPLTEFGIASQFSDINGINNTMFRATKYPSNFVGFIGKDLTPLGIIENSNSISDDCVLDLTVKSEEPTMIIINPVVNGQIEFTKSIVTQKVQLLNLAGELIFQWNSVDEKILNLPIISKGVYILSIPEREFQERIIVY